MGSSAFRRQLHQARAARPRPSPLRTHEPNLRVLRTIKKVEVEVLRLCPHQNPVIFASRRSPEADGLCADILAPPPLSRIKICVSAGVFEMTLMRVIEEPPQRRCPLGRGRCARVQVTESHDDDVPCRYAFAFACPPTRTQRRHIPIRTPKRTPTHLCRWRRKTTVLARASVTCVHTVYLLSIP
ncbi:hypothetical protein B0H11DRAFT_776858 [Mycena galericulata]|nr:hypothetical protein B0H11DRAFT_776858 [Mycena galericulata]